jgi:ribosome maturation factor RimP
MTIEDKIINWLTELEDKSVFLIAIDWKPGSKKLHVMMDGDNGITVEQCRKVNKLISLKLDEEDYGTEPYILEVSSPGADKPLLLLRQYHKHIGRELEVKLKNLNVITGKLVESDDEKVLLKQKDKKGRYTDQCEIKPIQWSEILESTVVISFK